MKTIYNHRLFETLVSQRRRKTIIVKEHPRKVQIGPRSPELSKLITWRRVEEAVFAACSKADRLGLTQSDRESARRVIDLLRDTFDLS